MKTLLKTDHTEIIAYGGIEMIKRPVASCILAIDGGMVIMVKQLRGTFGMMLEVPAGKVDEGEDSLQAVARELQEETGYTALNIQPLISYFPSVGYSTERIDCFWADNFSKTVNPQRLDDEERVTVERIPFVKVWDMVKDGTIKDSKTIMCIHSYLMRKQ